MNILKNRLANKRNSIYKRNNIYGDKDFKLIFKNGIKSVDIPNIFFNNYFQGKNSYYKFFKSECNRIINGNIDFESYNLKGLNRTKRIEERINKIFLETYGYSYELPYLHRISKKDNERLQLLYTNKENEIIIVDLYHLLIPAIDYEHKETTKNPQLHYEEVKVYKIGLEEIISNL
jgi:hypothetical protein